MTPVDYYAAYAFYKASGLPDAEAHANAEDVCLPDNLLQEVHCEKPEAHTTG